MDDDEFLELVERCRDPRGALEVLREAGRPFGMPPSAFPPLDKLLQDRHSSIVAHARSQER